MSFVEIVVRRLLLAGLVVWHRDVRLWLLAAVGVVCACFSFGLAFHHWTLWRLLVRFPLMDNVIPSRFVLFTYLAAAAMLGIVVDHVARAAAGRRPRPPGRTVLGWCAGLAVAHVTLHMALRDVFFHLSPQAVCEKARLLDGLLRCTLGRQPRLGVAALNPHASDGGLFGDEEERWRSSPQGMLRPISGC